MQPGSRIAHFEFIAPIGAGGMGEVYRARDTRLGRDVAIKVLPAKFAADPERLRRFEQEARAVAALSHPHILALFDVGTHEGSPYLVTELLEGESLQDRLRSGALPVHKAIELAVQIAQGLAAAHEKGIVHRDLKPANVFITKDGQVKILDFGLAKLMAPKSAEELAKQTTVVEATQAGAVLGTVGYMSPEQVRGQSVDNRTDIFSFGCVLYEMLSGGSPFRRDTAPETMAAILHEDPPPLTATVKSIPPAIESIVARCLEKRPEDRFSSAHDLALALRATSGGTETPATLPAMAPAPVRHPSRGRWIAISVVLAALIAAAVLGMHLLHRDAPTAPAVSTPSIAVLPFTNLSGDKDQEYFSDGLSEELMGLLTKVKELHVAGRISSFAFKGKDTKLADIGRELHVATVLEGSVRRSGNRLRVSAALVNVADGYQIWAESYDRTMSEVFAVQDDIAGAVVSALKVTLLPQERPAPSKHGTSNPEAYTQYLLGNHFLNLGSNDALQQAVEAYEAALKLDPSYAAAYAGLAEAAIELTNISMSVVEMIKWRQRAWSAAEEAIASDQNLAAGYAVRGLLRLLHIPPDWVGAQGDFERAIALNPGDVRTRVNHSILLASLGRLSEAVAEAQRATGLDPLSGRAWERLGWHLACSGDYSAARQALTRAAELSPGLVAVPYRLGVVFLLDGNPKGALLQFTQATGVSRLAGVSMAEHDLGHDQTSQRALDELTATYADNWAYYIARTYAWRGENGTAFAWLDRAYQEDDWAIVTLKTDPTLARLRSDPRFQALLRRMNFPASATP